MRLRRERAKHYKTKDGLFEVFQSNQASYEQRWYVNHKDFDETLVLGGFIRKRDAVAWLEKAYEAKADWLFGNGPDSR